MLDGIFKRNGCNLYSLEKKWKIDSLALLSFVLKTGFAKVTHKTCRLLTFSWQVSKMTVRLVTVNFHIYAFVRARLVRPSCAKKGVIKKNAAKRE